MKRCTKCGQYLKLTEFYIVSGTNKPRSECKRCHYQAVRNWTQRFRDKTCAYSKKWRDQNPERCKEVVMAWRTKNREKRAAQKALQWRVKQGIISKQPCVVCSNPNSHGHHPDYTKPLEVLWLCPLHHKDIGAIGAAKIYETINCGG